ncbi:MAG: hypothetical protein ACI86S_001005 [Paracoccaceae bacterium]|jgi:uncharacterized protein YjiS (DUF1127 family)|tara:strand:- start:393 stop:641 length:249 start_codon:yes stop_codon:yes gene_type:complete
MALVLRRSMVRYVSTATHYPWKGYAMTLINSLYNTLGDRFAKHAAYTRTRREIANLPTELAIEDLGIFPSDADKIATRAVYG